MTLTKFKTTFLILEESPYERPVWKDLISLPWSIVAALFYLLPKAIWMLVTGKEIEHDEEEFHPAPGWEIFIEKDTITLERHYFYAEESFDDFYWHTVDGFQLRAKPEIPGLAGYYFVRNSLFEFSGGLIAQAIQVGGNRHSCPLLFVDFDTRNIEVLQPLDKVYVLDYNPGVENRLLVKGKSADDGFELYLRPYT
jgi:hypothetical protein